jgi:O-antigen/teichoic acid export membrane protein
MIRRRLLTGTCSNLAAKVTAVGTWFVLTPFLLEKLGTGGFALWVLLTSIAWYGFLLDLGIGGAIVKYIAEHVARGERQAARELVASAVWLFTGLAIAALLLGVLVAPILPGILGVAPEAQPEAAWLIMLTGVNVATTIGMTPSFAVLLGLQRYDLHNGAHIVATLTEAAAVVAALLAGGGLLGMVAAFIPANIVTWCLAAWLVRRTAPDLRVRWRGATLGAVRKIACFSGSLFVIDFSGRLQTKTDEFIIALFRPLAAVTPYALARKLAELSEAVVAQCVKATMPLASELHAGADIAKLQRLYIAASRIAIGISTPICIVLVFLGGPILTLWVGASYASYAPLVAVLAIAYAFRSSQRPAIEILQGMARHHVIAATALASGVINVVLSVLLLPRIGLLGAAFAMLIPSALATVCVVMPFANRTLHVTWQRALREIWISAGLPAGVAAALLWTVLPRLEADPLGMVIVGGALTAVVYGIGYLSMPDAGVERRLLADLVIGASRRLRRPPHRPPHVEWDTTHEPVKEAL